MKKIYLVAFIIFSLFQTVYAQENQDEAVDSDEIDSELLESINAIVEKEKSIIYDTGLVHLSESVELKVPPTYKFMKKDDARYVVEELWGNPEDDNVLGMLVRDSFTLLNQDWAFIVSYEQSGYVKDEDANDIDYDELLESMQESEEEWNKERVEAGYPTIHTSGWAAKPFYDDENNILHWAKVLEFNRTDTTLNYDVRILGRKGILSLNAVGTMDQLGDIQKHIPDIIHIAKFKEGHTYADFDPDIDEVAAYTIGGLVAGKLLAKAGIFALILKNIKFVILGAVALFGSFRKKIASFFGRREEEDPIASDLNSNRDVDRDISNQENS